jgi:uncharacterized cupredoxin-like copper-binding protein
MKKLLIIPGIVVILMGIGLLTNHFLAAPARQVNVTINESEVVISANLIAVNEQVKFIITNMGKRTHEVVLERVGAIDVALQQGEGQETTRATEIQPGETRIVTWTIVSPGKYQLACHLPGQYEAGMVQPFSVGSGADENILGQTGGLILVSMSVLLLAGTCIGALSISQQNRVFVYGQVRARPFK